MDVIDEISSVETDPRNDRPREPVTIDKIEL